MSLRLSVGSGSQLPSLLSFAALSRDIICCQHYFHLTFVSLKETLIFPGSLCYWPTERFFGSMYISLQYLTNTDIKVHSPECLIKILASASLHKACIKTRSFRMLTVHVYFGVFNCLHIFPNSTGITLCFNCLLLSRFLKGSSDTLMLF